MSKTIQVSGLNSTWYSSITFMKTDAQRLPITPRTVPNATPRKNLFHSLFSLTFPALSKDMAIPPYQPISR